MEGRKRSSWLQLVANVPWHFGGGQLAYESHHLFAHE
jgi:hypothetical protein